MRGFCPKERKSAVVSQEVREEVKFEGSRKSVNVAVPHDTK